MHPDPSHCPPLSPVVVPCLGVSSWCAAGVGVPSSSLPFVGASQPFDKQKKVTKKEETEPTKARERESADPIPSCTPSPTAAAAGGKSGGTTGRETRASTMRPSLLLAGRVGRRRTRCERVSTSSEEAASPVGRVASPPRQETTEARPRDTHEAHSIGRAIRGDGWSLAWVRGLGGPHLACQRTADHRARRFPCRRGERETRRQTHTEGENNRAGDQERSTATSNALTPVDEAPSWLALVGAGLTSVMSLPFLSLLFVSSGIDPPPPLTRARARRHGRGPSRSLPVG